MQNFKRVFLIVLDSFGIGGASDAKLFGDDNPNTLASCASSTKFSVPNLAKLGLFNIDGVNCCPAEKNPQGAFGRLIEASAGKDTTIGHWEIAGVISNRPLPTYPEGFPPDVIAALEKSFGRKILCNKPYSGTQVIHDFGREHVETGALIVYTSADSVFQIAAHEDVVPVDELYDYCRTARKFLRGTHGVGRVIARPFVGEYPNYERTSRRHDFSLEPPAETILDTLKKNNLASIGVGKISDIFAARGITRSLGVNEDNRDGMSKTLRVMDEDFRGLCFVNLVDFDMKFGHRRDVDGYAQALTDFDVDLGKFLSKMRTDDLLMMTADHGCDPKAHGTDHTRENVPLIVCGEQIQSGVNLGTRRTFADIAATLAEIFNVDFETRGESFLRAII
ncbi:MAG: phosphopentomutase [Selenomonadaceae bacterium]|nr:phosphopentomutase [Selenomonadaceae bacterium]